MPPDLVLGPMLRHAGETEATVWVETSALCEVEVLDRATRTFAIAGHHYAIVVIEDLEPGSSMPYEVTLDGETVWSPRDDCPYPESCIRTLEPDATLDMAFGSCRVCAPHSPPYSLRKDEDDHGREVDALVAFADRMSRQDPSQWPQIVLLLGDQVYADEVSPGVAALIRRRRSTQLPPGIEIADFEEYTQLYREAWSDPSVRWLLSTVPTAMIFDDHDVNDDWNISAEWVGDMRQEPWWDARITGAFMSSWLYQRLGNLSPPQLEEEELLPLVRADEDAGPRLREAARRWDRESAHSRWAYYRDFGDSRLLVIDSRAARVLDEERREMIDGEEWNWI